LKDVSQASGNHLQRWVITPLRDSDAARINYWPGRFGGGAMLWCSHRAIPAGSRPERSSLWRCQRWEVARLVVDDY